MEVNKVVTHVIFDVDGLLLNTEDIYTEIYNELCSCYGKTFSWPVKSQMMGRTERQAAAVLIDALNLPISVDDYCQFVHNKEREMFPQAQFLPGAERLVRHLHTHGIPIAVCTASGRELYDMKTSKHRDIFSLFHHAVCSKDDPEVKHGKPEPDGFLVAARRFQQPPKDMQQVLVLEDAVNGVQGALSAGMRVVWIPDDRCDTSTITDPTVVLLNTLKDLDPAKFGLPAYD